MPRATATDYDAAPSLWISKGFPAEAGDVSLVRSRTGGAQGLCGSRSSRARTGADALGTQPVVPGAGLIAHPGRTDTQQRAQGCSPLPF